MTASSLTAFSLSEADLPPEEDEEDEDAMGFLAARLDLLLPPSSFSSSL